MPDTPLPQHPIDAQINEVAGRWLLSLERPVGHSCNEIWQAITDKDVVRRWAPFAPDRDLTETGVVALRQVDDPELPATPGRVVTAAMQRMLSLDWGKDRIDIELAPTADESVVHLSHTFDDRTMAPSFAAGWHLCLQALDSVLNGEDTPIVVGDAAHAAGWDELYDRYAALFEQE
ncbi:Uncharacterized conserved protein YndB, AHSA1/START domain [Paramicrobacterium humi]|uniref:Uncharacterized conserved protein YndB, AHSA1/START domain n=1 Tax=Paramicrobacterium humi TaxID=640635 RepID=A0A1H4M577_9MICO|nr:SRPBCC domain-containing protein [Microbacterium humi]SEB78146.1 Uncharacterized conserved protein YndB, AHSA1/START domain [Microbacterium humi]